MQNVSPWALGPVIASVAGVCGRPPVPAVARIAPQQPVLGFCWSIWLAMWRASSAFRTRRCLTSECMAKIPANWCWKVLLGWCVVPGAAAAQLLWRGRGKCAGGRSGCRPGREATWRSSCLVHAGCAWGRAQGWTRELPPCCRRSACTAPAVACPCTTFCRSGLLGAWHGCAAYWNVPTRYRTRALRDAGRRRPWRALVAWLAGAVRAVEIPARYLASYPSRRAP